MEFTVKSLSGYASAAGFSVQAPEIATFEFLKRRIMKAKLNQGEVCIEAKVLCLVLCVTVQARGA